MERAIVTSGQELIPEHLCAHFDAMTQTLEAGSLQLEAFNLALADAVGS